MKNESPLESDPTLLIEHLRRGNTDTRIYAAHALTKIRTPAAREVLREALFDVEAIVRVHAWNGLVDQLGLTDLAAVRHGPLGVLRVRLYTDLASVRTAAAHDLRGLFKRLEAGASPAHLGLEVSADEDPPALNKFIASLDTATPAIDLDALRSLDPSRRAWAEAVIVAALKAGDARAIAALIALDARWAAPALTDAAVPLDDLGLRDSFRQAAAAAARRLGTDCDADVTTTLGECAAADLDERVVGVLDLTRIPPQLILTWPPIASGATGKWCDVARIGVDTMLRENARVRRFITGALGKRALDEMLDAIRAAGELCCEPPLWEQRAWSRNVEKGFCAGDLTETDALVVTGAEVRAFGYSHSYGDNDGGPGQSMTIAEFLDPACPQRVKFAECLSRIDPYLRGMVDA